VNKLSNLKRIVMRMAMMLKRIMLQKPALNAKNWVEADQPTGLARKVYNSWKKGEMCEATEEDWKLLTTCSGRSKIVFHCWKKGILFKSAARR